MQSPLLTAETGSTRLDIVVANITTLSVDAIVNAVKAATGAKGQALWKPLRLALTGTPEGPELAPLLHAMPDSAIHDRLNRFAA